MARAKKTQSNEAAPTAAASLEEARIAVSTGADKKAENIVVLDVRTLTSYADYLVIMSASSDRQVSAIADAIDDELRKAGHRPIGVEGSGTSNWVLIDTGDIVVHVFLEEAREFYDLDRLWADAPRIDLAESKPSTAKV
jgi:ribosome-associated protein